jgi:hypothetical protein
MSTDDTIFYFCGLKRMYTSVLEMLEVSTAQNALLGGIFTHATIAEAEAEAAAHTGGMGVLVET